MIRNALNGFLGALTVSVGQVTAAPNIVSLIVEPPRIVLHGANRQQQLLVTGRRSDGRQVDLTTTCEIVSSSSEVARVVGSTVAGVAEGHASLLVRTSDIEVSVSVEVRDFDEYPPLHFENDVMPILSKLGCNSGGCHGKPSGQNGFKLSVFGFDPMADYEALVKENRGRRVFPASPQRSLLLLKPTAQVAHGGGQRLEVGSKDYEVLYEWVRQGMPVGANDAPRLVSLEVRPTERVVSFSGAQQILATAIFSDGARRDVSTAALYTTNAELVAGVSQSGLVRTAAVPGEAAITVNYMGQVAAVRIQVPRPDAPSPYPSLPTNNRIDELVWAKLEKMGILPSELTDDATFLRRVYLDTIGTLPTPREVERFLSDRAADKRTRAIDRLLEREEYAGFWALKWADILLVDSQKLGGRGAFEFHRWLRAQFSRDRPYDQWVRELITATGNSGKNGPVNFYRAIPTPEEAGRTVSQAFLGVRLECAQCHHHPFGKWSRQDFYAMAGFFNGLERKTIRGERELIYHAGYRETRMPLSGELVPTRPLGAEVPAGIERGDPRVPLAAWITSPENPWFAHLAVNRLWKHFLGRGLVEPEDDFRMTNPATNQELLDFLAQSLVTSAYDLKSVMRAILSSRVYQLSSVPNANNSDDDQGFSHYYAKRLSAEALLDAICQVTGVPERYPGRPLGARAIDLWDNRMPSYFLDVFGRPARESPCECGRSSEPTMAQALHLMNAPEIEAKISSPEGRVAKLLAEAADPDRMVEEMCLAALGRSPGEREREVAKRLFAVGTPKEAAEDFLWTLLNSYEFLFVD